MVWNIFWLLAGLLLILAGANMLTDGASSISKRMGISDLIVGLTVVAFGTSAPELVISIVSAAEGSAPMAVGNVVGSNIFNILVIIGVTACVRPIKIERGVMINEIPLVILAAVVLVVMGNSAVLNDGGINEVSRVSAVLLLIFGLLFLRYTVGRARSSAQPELDPTAKGVSSKLGMPLWKACLWVIVGLAGLIFGGDKFVDGASGIASAFGISDAVIGLTIVAIGTSLPELATSIVASVKGEPGLAVGNVIGSNIFNVLFVLGIAGIVTPLSFDGINNIDLSVLLGASVMFWVFGWFFKERTITRWEGSILVVAYIVYMVYLVGLKV